MAIGTGAVIDTFGTADVVTAGGGTSAVSDGNFSADADTVTWTNDDDAPEATFSLVFQYPSGTITTGGIHLYMRLHNIESTNDEPIPDSGWENHFIGTFPTDSGMAATTDQSHALPFNVQLPNQYTSQVYEFAIKNNCGVSMTAGWTLTIKPKAPAPHA